jgi:dienelactone hydrolase
MRLATALAALTAVTIGVAAQSRSKWVYPGDDGRLQYGADARGNRIMDFSHAGFKGGGVRLPDVRAARTIGAIPGDNTSRIQAAIDEVSLRAPAADGFRGAVVLERGSYQVDGPLRIAASGVVLRGSGSGENGTSVRVSGAPHRFIDISGTGSWTTVGEPAAITDAYVPAGADSFTVKAADGFRTGDTVLVQRPITDAWIHFMGMDTLVRDGNKQTWIKPGTFINTDRVIKSIAGPSMGSGPSQAVSRDGNRITLDVPLSDSFDAAYLNPPGGSVVKYAFAGRIELVGLESLRVIVPAQDKPISESQYTLLRMNAVSDGWVRDVVSIDTQNSTTFGPTVRRVTVDNVHIRHTLPFTAPAAPADFAFSGTQILLDRSSVSGQGVWPVVTQAGVTGPNVVLNFKADGAGIAPHQRWATGLLVDSSEFTGGTDKRPNIAFSNREYAGSGHGWSVGWAVAWNVNADYLLIQQPPGAKNWCIGCTGRPARVLWNGNAVAPPGMPSETFESPGAAVRPASLYLAQLRDRLGPTALANIGHNEPLSPLVPFVAEIVVFPSGELTLHGVLYKPQGAGPFPAVVYNHGSAPGMLSRDAFEALGPAFARRGWVFFGPYRRGQGLSASAGPYIGDQIAAAERTGGISAGAAAMVRLLETDHLNDQLAALAWLRKQTFVQADRIAVAGNSFGGIETVLGAERGNYCAAIDSAGGAQSWAEAPELRSLMTRAVRNSKTPIFFFQAANDFDLSPSKTLSAALKEAGKSYEVRIYPAYGSSPQEGHTFGYFGSSIWADDVFRFLDQHCRG